MTSVVVARILAHALAPRRVTHVRASFEPRVPPPEIQLWNVGDNPTDFGVHKWTERSAASVMARYEARGNPLLVDVEHNGAKLPDAEPTTTAGYAKLEIREGAPWLVFDWSAYGAEQIATGQRRFLSPEYDVDRSTGEILALYRVSLVADPATHRARVLAAATNEESMDPKLAAIMAILKSVSDPAAAIDSIKSLVADLSGGDAGGAPSDAPSNDTTAAAPAPADGGSGGAPASGDDNKDKMAAAAPTTAPVAAAAPTPPATGATAAAPAAPAAAAAPADPAKVAAPDTSKVTAAATAAVQQIENAQRDHLITTQGDRLDPSIRRWASSQPLAVVNGLINAAPAKLDAPGRVAATRGDTQGKPAAAKGLHGKDLEEFQKAMGTFKASAPEPHETPAGVLVLPAVPPSIHRERMRIAAAAALAGKDGK